MVTKNAVNPKHAAATKNGKVRTVVAKAKVGTPKATRPTKSAKGATPATVRGMAVADLLALREATPRPELKLHYAIRRALRGAGYYISKNR